MLVAPAVLSGMAAALSSHSTARPSNTNSASKSRTSRANRLNRAACSSKKALSSTAVSLFPDWSRDVSPHLGTTALILINVSPISSPLVPPG